VPRHARRLRLPGARVLELGGGQRWGDARPPSQIRSAADEREGTQPGFARPTNALACHVADVASMNP